jgi:hypothetical protein
MARYNEIVAEFLDCEASFWENGTPTFFIDG